MKKSYINLKNNNRTLSKNETSHYLGIKKDKINYLISSGLLKSINFKDDISLPNLVDFLVNHEKETRKPFNWEKIKKIKLNDLENCCIDMGVVLPATKKEIENGNYLSFKKILEKYRGNIKRMHSFEKKLRNCLFNILGIYDSEGKEFIDWGFKNSFLIKPNDFLEKTIKKFAENNKKPKFHHKFGNSQGIRNGGFGKKIRINKNSPGY